MHPSFEMDVFEMHSLLQFLGSSNETSLSIGVPQVAVAVMLEDSAEIHP